MRKIEIPVSQGTLVAIEKWSNENERDGFEIYLRTPAAEEILLAAVGSDETGISYLMKMPVSLASGVPEVRFDENAQMLNIKSRPQQR